MQLGLAFNIAFYCIAAATLLGIFGLGAAVYRQESRLTWRDRLARAHRPLEQSEAPYMSYFAAAFMILMSLGFFAIFVGTTAGTGSQAIDGCIGLMFLVLGAIYILRGRRIAQRRRTT